MTLFVVVRLYITNLLRLCEVVVVKSSEAFDLCGIASMSLEELPFSAFNTLYYLCVAFTCILPAARHSLPIGTAAATTATTATALVDAA
jgi:hypothetical protein